MSKPDLDNLVVKHDASKCIECSGGISCPTFNTMYLEAKVDALLAYCKKLEVVAKKAARVSNAMVFEEDATRWTVPHPAIKTLEPEIGYAVNELRAALSTLEEG